MSNTLSLPAADPEALREISTAALTASDQDVANYHALTPVEKQIEKIKGDNPEYEDYVTAQQVLNMRAVKEARKIVEAETSPAGYNSVIPQTLAEILQQPDAPIDWRISGLMQEGHNVTLTAAAKTGKTSLQVNLLRSLADGKRLFGEFKVKPVEGSIVVFNHELSEKQFNNWLRRAGIENAHKIVPVHLRGKNLFLQDEPAQDWAIELLRRVGAEVWIIDPLQAALRGSVKDDEVAVQWTAAADRVKAEAGVGELLLVTHTGHLGKRDENGRSDNERSAGSARWLGWPDAMWTYVRDDQGTRYLSAEGRDIDVPERAMGWDERTITLTSKGEGSGRAERRQSKAYRAVTQYMRENPDAHITSALLKTRLPALKSGEVSQGLREAEEAGVIEPCDCDHRTASRGPKPQGYVLSGAGQWLNSRN